MLNSPSPQNPLTEVLQILEARIRFNLSFIANLREDDEKISFAQTFLPNGLEPFISYLEMINSFIKGCTNEWKRYQKFVNQIKIILNQLPLDEKEMDLLHFELTHTKINTSYGEALHFQNYQNTFFLFQGSISQDEIKQKLEQYFDIFREQGFYETLCDLLLPLTSSFYQTLLNKCICFETFEEYTKKNKVPVNLILYACRNSQHPEIADFNKTLSSLKERFNNLKARLTSEENNPLTKLDTLDLTPFNSNITFETIYDYVKSLCEEVKKKTEVLEHLDKTLTALEQKYAQPSKKKKRKRKKKKPTDKTSSDETSPETTTGSVETTLGGTTSSPASLSMSSANVSPASVDNITDTLENINLSNSAPPTDPSKPIVKAYTPQLKSSKIKPISIKEEEPKPLAQRLLKYRETLDALFQNNIHLKFTYTALSDLIKAAGGKIVPNGKKGSSRRIEFDGNITFTCEPISVTVHAPHGRYKENTPMAKVFASHFKAALELAGITPEKLWPKNKSDSPAYDVRKPK